jgi:protein-tyrosine phosphatase
MTYRLLFVCLGNICRSPSAENIMNHLILERGLQAQISCDSAGTSNYHIGDPPDRRMSNTLKRRGLPNQGEARQFTSQDFVDFDLILAMDRSNLEDILALDPQRLHSDKVKLMCEFARVHSHKEVPDPYYGGATGFEKVVDLLLDSCQGLLDYVSEQILDPNK